MQVGFRPIGPYSIIALLVIIFAILGMVGVIAFGPLEVYGLILLLAIGLFF